MTTCTAPTPTRRRPGVWATVTVVLALAGLNVANHVLGWGSLWLGPVGAIGLLGFARWSGLSWSQLGLARRSLGAGLRWGGAVVGIVGLGYLVGVAVPATRVAFLDARYHLPPAGALLTAFVVIPLGTVLLEEVAFRSVLWGFLASHIRMWQVALGSALLFGLWHLLPALATAVANPFVAATVMGAGALSHLVAVGGTVLFTAVGGLIAGELRRRSGSLLASLGMHWATNALGVLFGLVAWSIV